MIRNAKTFPPLPPTRCDGLRPDVPADDCPILRQAVFSADTTRTLVHHPRGGVDAGHQRCGGEHRVPYHGGTPLAEATAGGHAAALHPALEAAALRGVLRHPQEAGRIPVLHSRPGPATGDVHRRRNGEGMAFHEKGRGRTGGGTGPGADTGVLPTQGRGYKHGRKERTGLLLPLPDTVPAGTGAAGTGDGGRHAAATGVPVPHSGFGGCGHPRR